MTAAEELAAAAFQLRNPFHQPGLKVGIDAEFGFLLADWLEHEGARLHATTHPDWQSWLGAQALAVARAVLGQPDGSQP